ncbi:unnamed protein product [Amoebophrya sp. A120]|nr:unnamed protein product [Amoebophrya sp. A120]|eukprot:GSA120T00006310001.1
MKKGNSSATSAFSGNKKKLGLQGGDKEKLKKLWSTTASKDKWSNANWYGDEEEEWEWDEDDYGSYWDDWEDGNMDHQAEEEVDEQKYEDQKDYNTSENKPRGLLGGKTNKKPAVTVKKADSSSKKQKAISGYNLYMNAKNAGELATKKTAIVGKRDMKYPKKSTTNYAKSSKEANTSNVVSGSSKKAAGEAPAPAADEQPVVKKHKSRKMAFVKRGKMYNKARKVEAESIVLKSGVEIQACAVKVGDKLCVKAPDGKTKELCVELATAQQETLWKYKHVIKDPIKRLQLAGDPDLIKKQVVRVSPVTCSEPGVTFINRGDRISQKIWCANYKDLQGRRHNKWFNCKHYVDLRDSEEERAEKAQKRAMAVAVNFIRDHREKMAAAGHVQKELKATNRKSGVLGVRWADFQNAPHRKGWVANISCKSFTGPATAGGGRHARPVTRSFTIDDREYEDDPEGLELALEECRQKAIAQRKNWEKEVFVFEEAAYPKMDLKNPDNPNKNKGVLADQFLPRSGNAILDQGQVSSSSGDKNVGRVPARAPLADYTGRSPPSPQKFSAFGRKNSSANAATSSLKNKATLLAKYNGNIAVKKNALPGKQEQASATTSTSASSSFYKTNGMKNQKQRFSLGLDLGNEEDEDAEETEGDLDEDEEQVVISKPDKKPLKRLTDEEMTRELESIKEQLKQLRPKLGDLSYCTCGAATPQNLLCYPCKKIHFQAITKLEARRAVLSTKRNTLRRARAAMAEMENK